MTTLLDRNNENGVQPLYVKIPKEFHVYLDQLKDKTGLSKSDCITLILIVARRLVGPKTILELFDDYMLRGEDGLEIINSITALYENEEKVEH